MEKSPNLRKTLINIFKNVNNRSRDNISKLLRVTMRKPWKSWAGGDIVYKV